MPPDDNVRNDDTTYNELANEDREWLERNGYQPGELTHQEIEKLREETDDGNGPDATIADEQDGTEANGA